MQKKKSLDHKHLFVWIVLLTIPISGFTTDIYVPSLPAVTAYFGTSKALVQLTMTAYLLGFGFASLFSGALVDSFGRKKPFNISMAIYILTSLFVLFLSNITQLLILRCIQGLAMSFVMIAMRAVISDLFKGKDFYKMMNYTTIAWAIGPIIAPAIGGYLQYYFGWRAPFLFLVFYGLVTLILNLLYVPETVESKNTFNFKKIGAQYRKILSHYDFLVGLFCLGFLYGMLLLFGVVAPFLIQEQLHYSSITFGHIALLVGVLWLLGSITNRFLVDINCEQKIKYCFIAMLLIGSIALFWAFIFPMTIWNIVVPSGLMLYFASIIFPNYFASSVALFPDSPGTANSLMSSSMVFVSAFCTVMDSLLKSDSQIPFILSYLVIVFLGFLLYCWRGRFKGAATSQP